MVKPGTRLGYMLGLNRDVRPYERPVPTGEEKFQSLIGEQGGYSAVGRLPQGESPGKGKRKAGDGLNLYLRQVFGEGKFAPLPPMSAGGIPPLDDLSETV